MDECLRGGSLKSAPSPGTWQRGVKPASTLVNVEPAPRRGETREYRAGDDEECRARREYRETRCTQLDSDLIKTPGISAEGEARGCPRCLGGSERE